MIEISLSLHEYDAAIAKLIGEIKMGIDKNDPLLSQIQVSSDEHRGKIRQVSAPEIVETESAEHREKFEVPAEVFLKTDVDEFVMLFWGLAESFNTQMKKSMFETLNATTEAIGNSVDMKGKSFWDARIEMLNKMDVQFDNYGKPTFQIFVNPNTYKKLMETPPTSEQEQQWEEALKAKREEYYAKKRTRRLS